MESILQGWLTKSPPEKKQFKLFGSKWRKRYFVLYAPPTVDGIPDAYTAILEYYSSKKLHHKCGTINLTDCEEVLSSLDSDIYKHVFGLRTMHKGQLRTYYLAADTEPEMTKWVNRLCQVLGLTENDDSIGSPPSQFPQRMQQTMRVAQPMKIPGSTRPFTHQSPLGAASSLQSPAPPPPRPVTSMPSAPFTRLNISEPNLLDVASPKSCVDVRRETVDVAWQMASPPGTSRVASPPGSSRMRNAESFPELDRFSPASRKPGEGRELPPIPPEKSGPKVVPEPSVDLDYDLPKQKYYEHNDSEDPEASRNGTFYNSPPGRNNANGENDAGWYNKPQILQVSNRSHGPAEHSAADDECYNIPKSQLDKRKHASQGEEFYNIPKSSNSSDWQNFSQLPRKKSDRRSYGGQRLIRPEFPGSLDQMEDYSIAKSKLSDREYEDDYNVPKSALIYNFPQEGGYNSQRSKDLPGFDSGVDVYNFPKHQIASQDKVISDRPKCLWEMKAEQGAFDGKQPSNDHSQILPAQNFHPVHGASGKVSSDSLAAAALVPPEKPPRPVSRPSPDRQFVAGQSVNFETEQSNSSLQPDFKYSHLSAEENQGIDGGALEIVGASELKKTPSGAFKQNKSTVQSSSSIHKRQVASNLPILDSIRFTQRTKSFKRSIPSQDRSTLPLPVKRIVERSESSSSASSDDEGDRAVAVQGNSFA